MALTRFKTDLRLWFWSSLVALVLLSFALPIGEDDPEPVFVLWIRLIASPAREMRDNGWNLKDYFYVSLFFVSSSVLVGWVLLGILLWILAFAYSGTKV